MTDLIAVSFSVEIFLQVMVNIYVILPCFAVICRIVASGSEVNTMQT